MQGLQLLGRTLQSGVGIAGEASKCPERQLEEGGGGGGVLLPVWLAMPHARLAF